MKAPPAGFIDGGQPSTSRADRGRVMPIPEPPTDWMDSQAPNNGRKPPPDWIETEAPDSGRYDPPAYTTVPIGAYGPPDLPNNWVESQIPRSIHDDRTPSGVDDYSVHSSPSRRGSTGPRDPTRGSSRDMPRDYISREPSRDSAREPARVPRWRGEHPDDILHSADNHRNDDIIFRADGPQSQAAKRRRHKGNTYMGIKDDKVEKESCL